ncbi:MAG: SpoIIE family protein phosphatase [Deltaproteobacteria bacterium]|nr:SpoIIE family protein phosphatase [Deltaproteobacteria bacterium]
MSDTNLNLDSQQFTDRVLVISNNPLILSQINTALQKKSYECQNAENLKEASKFATQRIYDLVIIELNEREENCYELLAQVQAESNIKRLPIILLAKQNPLLLEALKAQSSLNIHLISLPLSITDLLVKVTTQMRIRKTSTKHSKLGIEVTAENTELRELTNRFRRELREAQVIQQSLLPKSLPLSPLVRFAAKYVPLDAVGGDFYDIWKLGESLFAILIADVSGHGLSAAFVAAMTKMALSYTDASEPHEILFEMNSGLTKHMPEGRFVTAIAAIYNSENACLQIARAGHPEPIIWRAKECKAGRVNAEGLPLGLLSDSTYSLYETKLEKGDKLLLFTDGLTETSDMSGAMLGLSGIENFLSTNPQDCDVVKLLDRIYNFQKEFSGGRIIKDDITIIGLERLK